VAIVALICRVEEAAPGDLALTVSAGRELANLLQMERLMQESQHHLSELYALLDGMEDGVLAWDPQGGCATSTPWRPVGCNSTRLSAWASPSITIC
jgi:PAS domain-containing protein